MTLKTLALACLCSVALPALVAAQQPAQPTTKDKVDKAISTVTGSPMANADTDMKHVLDSMASLKPKPIEDLTPAEARQQPTAADGVAALLKQQGQDPAPDASVTTKMVSYPAAGASQEAKVYMPADAKGPLPIVVYYHGGGFVIADVDTYDAAPRALAKDANVIVVSAEYRHAPENKFPAAHDDAFAAYEWVLKSGASIGGDTSKVAIMGESAGGNLATNVAIQARDRKVQPPAYVVAVYPVAGTNVETRSYKDNASAKPLNKDMMEWFVANLVRSNADKSDPRLDIVGKADLKGLPPFTIVTAQIDPLHDDGALLADKLKAAGVNVRYRDYPGVTHEFFGMGRAVQKAREAELAVAADVRSALGGDITGAMRKAN